MYVEKEQEQITGSVTDALNNERVVEIEKRNNGRIRFRESCDGYFCVELAPSEVDRLIVELQELVAEVRSER